MRIWRSHRSHFPRHPSFFCIRNVVCVVSPSASLLIQFFPILLHLCRLPRIVVLIQYVWENVMNMGESHEHRRIA